MTQQTNKIRVGLIFGGRSGEHEVSLRSAQSVFEAIDRDRFEVSLIGIDPRGRWHLVDESRFRALSGNSASVLSSDSREVALLAAPDMGRLIDPQHPARVREHLDVVFPVLHGTFGEDGTVQGFLDLADIPYVGAGVLGSAIGMDKDVQKRLLQAAGIPVVPFVSVSHHHWQQQQAAVLGTSLALGLPLFVKPANLGSSVGITKVKSDQELSAAIEAAFQFDLKIVIEKGIDAREIECAVLGNDDPIVSIPGEIRPNAEFYSYEAKYIDENGAALLIPAPLTAQQTQQVRSLALRVFQLLECAGMARVDCFLERPSGDLYLNEINTLPGFTSISMYPKLWEASGIPYRDLISRLLDLAVERHSQRRRLRRSFLPQTDPA